MRGQPGWRILAGLLTGGRALEGRRRGVDCRLIRLLHRPGLGGVIRLPARQGGVEIDRIDIGRLRPSLRIGAVGAFAFEALLRYRAVGQEQRRREEEQKNERALKVVRVHVSPHRRWS